MAEDIKNRITFGGEDPTPTPPPDGGDDNGDEGNDQLDWLTDDFKKSAVAGIEGAADIDDSGNLLDAGGKILKSVEDLKGWSPDGGDDDSGGGDDDDPPGEFVVAGDDGEEDVTYTLNKDGAAVDEDGKVIYTKEQVEEMSNPGLYAQLKQQLGYEVDGEFEDSVDGAADYIRKVGEQISEKRLNDMFDEYPELKRHYEHLSHGGNTTDLYGKGGPIDFEQLNIEKDDVVTQESVVQAYLSEVKGLSDEEIKPILKSLKDEKRLYDKSKVYLDDIKENYQAEQQEIVKEQEKVHEQQVEEYKNTQKEVKQMITGGKVLNYVIPDAEKQEFFEYLYKPIEKNKSQRDLDRNEIPLDKALALEYILYKQFKPTVQVKNKKPLSGKLQTKSSGSRMRGQGGSPRHPDKTKPLGNIKLSDVIPTG